MAEVVVHPPQDWPANDRLEPLSVVHLQLPALVPNRMGIAEIWLCPWSPNRSGRIGNGFSCKTIISRIVVLVK
jgi:hypothetical protein